MTILPRSHRHPVLGLLAMLAVVATGTALPACADGLADVRAALAKLDGHEPLRASVEMQVFNQTKEDGKPRPEQGKATVRVEDGTDGLKVTFPRAAFERAAQEERARRADPERTTPTNSVLRDLHAKDLAEALSFAGPLLNRLDKATLTADRPDTTGGKPARQLTLKLEPSLAQVERKHVKEASLTMKLWLGPDNVPFAAESTLKVKAGILLFNFTTENHDRWDFTRAGNRLIVARHHTEVAGEGLGQQFERKATMLVSLEGELGR